MNHDAADLAMFWVGALFAFTPLAFFGVVIGVWWYQQKKKARGRKADHEGAGAAPPGGAPRESGDPR
jgi:cbb3-type cytochrome oxidase subunit 3